jgi:hypothetical protein
MVDLNKAELRKFEAYKIYNKRRDKKKPFIDNSIHTAKYNVLTFLPKNLFFQFCKLANAYFLFVAFVDFNVNDRFPTVLLPLTFVVVVSMIKDIFEDYKRHQSDNRVNYKTALVGDQ